eukprot:7067309-Prymnesium_polylepis.3
MFSALWVVLKNTFGVDRVSRMGAGRCVALRSASRCSAEAGLAYAESPPGKRLDAEGKRRALPSLR